MNDNIFDLKKKSTLKNTKESNTYEFIYLTLKMSAMVALITINIIAVSVSLNCNANASYPVKIISSIFAFLFGFIYLFVNYYSYRVLTLRQTCAFNKATLFPFMATVNNVSNLNANGNVLN